MYVPKKFTPAGRNFLGMETPEKLDYPVVMGSVLISATFFILINILADVLYGVVDPRVRLN